MIATALAAKITDGILSYREARAQELSVKFLSPEHPIPQAEQQRLRQEMHDYIASGAVLDEIEYSSDEIELDDILWPSGQIFNQELKQTVARLAYSNNQQSLRHVLGRDYQSVADDIGWEDPSELMNVQTWSELVDRCQYIPQEMMKTTTRRILTARADEWHEQHETST